MLFEVREIYTKADLAALSRIAVRRPRRGPLKSIVRAGSVFAGIFLLLCAVLLLRAALTDRSFYAKAHMLIFTWAIIVVLFYLSLTMLLGYDPVITLLSWYNYRHKGLELRYGFEEDQFTEISPLGEGRYDYAVILEVWEDQDRFFLFISQTAAHIMRKDSFTQGEFEAFRGFISQKTGRPMEQV